MTKADNKPIRSRATVIRRASRMGRIRDGLVLCDNCDNPADDTSRFISWTGCGPCIFGEADALDPEEFISVGGGSDIYTRVRLTPNYIKALKKLMAEHCSMMRRAEPQYRSCWEWGRCEVGDLASANALSFEYGGGGDAPPWGGSLTPFAVRIRPERSEQCRATDAIDALEKRDD